MLLGPWARTGGCGRGVRAGSAPFHRLAPCRCSSAPPAARPNRGWRPLIRCERGPRGPSTAACRSGGGHVACCYLPLKRGGYRCPATPPTFSDAQGLQMIQETRPCVAEAAREARLALFWRIVSTPVNLTDRSGRRSVLIVTRGHCRVYSQPCETAPSASAGARGSSRVPPLPCDSDPLSLRASARAQSRRGCSALLPSSSGASP